MRIIGPFVIGLAIVMSALSSTEASAATICNGCDYSGTSQYLGLLNPNTLDQSTYVHNNIPDGAFSDVWVFDISPSGDAFLSAIYNPTNNVSTFAMTLYNVTSSVGCALDAACTSVTLGGQLATTSGAFALAIQNFSLAAGQYAFVISGTSSGQPTTSQSYGGNLSTQPQRVPDGGSTMMLLGSVLVGFGAFRRKFTGR